MGDKDDNVVHYDFQPVRKVAEPPITDPTEAHTAFNEWLLGHRQGLHIYIGPKEEDNGK